MSAGLALDPVSGERNRVRQANLASTRLVKRSWMRDVPMSVARLQRTDSRYRLNPRRLTVGAIHISGIIL